MVPTITINLAVLLAVVPAHAARQAPTLLRARGGERKSTQAPRPSTLLRLRGGDGQSVSSAAIVAAKVCPALGFVLSNALYASPVSTLSECKKKGSLGSLNPLPSALMVISTTAWVAYGLSGRNPWIAATNIPGALVAYWQLVTMLPLLPAGPLLSQVQTIVLGGAAASLLLSAWLAFGGFTEAARAQAFGMFATVVCVILFASPLSTMATVLKQRNSDSILTPLTLSQCANCALWTTYGVFAAKDVFVWGPNGTGLVLGLAQLALKVLFPSSRKAA